MISRRPKESGIGVDGLGPGFVEPVDVDGADEVSVAEDLVLSGSGGGTPGAGDGLPGQLDDVPALGPLAADDGSGDDPVEDDLVDVRSAADRESTGVLSAGGVDPVDDVGAGDAGALLELGHTTGGEPQAQDQEPGESAHALESKNGIHPIFKTALAIGGLIVVAVMAFAIFEPVQVLPRIRLAPGFALVDQSGSMYTSDDGKGSVTLYAFAPAGCGAECDRIHETMADVGEIVSSSVDLGPADFRMVTVALNTADPETLAGEAAATGADGEVWRWAGARDAVLRDVVGSGFRVYYDATDPTDVSFDPTFVIVDGNGLIRGEYPYSSISSDADRLSRHIGILGEEILFAKGNNKLIYEAAHIFLCYP